MNKHSSLAAAFWGKQAAVLWLLLLLSCFDLPTTTGTPGADAVSHESLVESQKVCSFDESDEHNGRQCKSQSEEDATIPSDNQNDHDESLNAETFHLFLAETFHNFLAHMFEKVDQHAASLGDSPDLQAQEHYILSTWLDYFEMSPDVISQNPLAENWMFQLYQKTKSIAPELFFRTFDERAKPSYDEIQILLSIDDSALKEARQPDDGTINENILMNHLFSPFRHRGFQMSLVDVFARVLLGPLKSIGYAIPSNDNLKVIAEYGPLIEVGAGTGYWSAALQLQGVDILPFDADPPSQDKRGLYFDRTYTQVQNGSCQSIFEDGRSVLGKQHDTKNRTLLMVWPNNPDNVDNAAVFHSDVLPPVWDLDCARAYTKEAGDNATIILVSERETNIHVLPSHPQNPTQPDSGLCASRAFQQFLLDEFDLVHRMDIPTWIYSDDLTIWRRKKKIQ